MQGRKLGSAGVIGKRSSVPGGGLRIGEIGLGVRYRRKRILAVRESEFDMGTIVGRLFGAR